MWATIKSTITWAGGFFTEGSGQSSTRLVMVGGVFLPLLAWLGVTAYHATLQPIPESVLVFIGMCLGMKSAHKFLETRPAVITKTAIVSAPAAAPVEVNVNPPA